MFHRILSFPNRSPCTWRSQTRPGREDIWVDYCIQHGAQGGTLKYEAPGRENGLATSSNCAIRPFSWVSGTAQQPHGRLWHLCLAILGKLWGHYWSNSSHEIKATLRKGHDVGVDKNLGLLLIWASCTCIPSEVNPGQGSMGPSHKSTITLFLNLNCYLPGWHFLLFPHINFM